MLTMCHIQKELFESHFHSLWTNLPIATLQHIAPKMEQANGGTVGQSDDSSMSVKVKHRGAVLPAVASFSTPCVHTGSIYDEFRGKGWRRVHRFVLCVISGRSSRWRQSPTQEPSHVKDSRITTGRRDGVFLDLESRKNLQQQMPCDVRPWAVFPTSHTNGMRNPNQHFT